jgi:hopene-associated glycosyltransferase HpnB
MTSFSPLAALALLSLSAWAWLIVFRGGFWRADQRLGRPAEPASWPPVIAVVPARNEAAHVGEAVASLLGQDYPGAFRIVLVDDASEDGTAEAAQRGAAGSDRLTVIAGRPLEAGWAGKMWAVSQGLAAADRIAPDAAYVLLTDADIAHDAGNLRRLAAKAETEGLDLVSLMVRLRCRTVWERLLIPAFVFFFQKLYPFPWANDPRNSVAAAAGGCMLVRRSALRRIGGVAAIRDAVIDDCALARAVKRDGRIWVGLADRHGPRSLRGYDGLGGIWRMVARTAYVQLRHSPLLLGGTVLGMAVLYVVPPAAVVIGAAAGDGPALVLGVAGWATMWACYRPTLADYGRPVLAGLALPVAAALYLAMTVDSARRTRAGQGAAWKGRTYPARPRTSSDCRGDSAEAE